MDPLYLIPTIVIVGITTSSIIFYRDLKPLFQMWRDKLISFVSRLFFKMICFRLHEPRPLKPDQITEERNELHRQIAGIKTHYDYSKTLDDINQFAKIYKDDPDLPLMLDDLRSDLINRHIRIKSKVQ